MSFEMHLPLIVVFTSGGTAARLISKYRPKAHIIAVSD
jgi:pyruvate kinase